MELRLLEFPPSAEFITMAYDPVAQVDRDVLSEESNSAASASPPPNDSSHPISVESENLGNNLPYRLKTAKENTDTRLGSMVRSMASTGTSYDMVEDDDYEDIQETPVKNKGSHPDVIPQPHSPPHEALGRIRTSSIGPKLPLRHPTPDLQSAQGAYVRNVERLEESAERLSMTSSLEEELQKMKFEQRQLHRQSSAPAVSARPFHLTTRQFSSSSLSNSVVAIDTAVTSVVPSAPQHNASSKGSIVSGSLSYASNAGRSTSKGSRFAQPLSENDLGQSPPQDLPPPVPSTVEPPRPPPHTYHPASHARRLLEEPSQKQDTEDAGEARPSTSASSDTYRQATSLFVDFDGVHYTSHSHLAPSRQVSLNRQIPISQPPLATDATSFKDPPAGESMVYYPAPVPMMLNLPQKLSKLPSPAEREWRRMKALGAMPSEMRKSAAWLNEDGKPFPSDDPRASQVPSSLPPHLRASAFFDQPALGQNIDIKGASAVKTLDSILDASAHAPVSAFTDHPFAGHLGGEVYGAEKGKSRSATLDKKKKRRTSITNLLRTSTGLTSDPNVARPASPSAPSAVPQNKLTKKSSKLGLKEDEAALANEEGAPLRTASGNEDTADEPRNRDGENSESDKEEEVAAEQEEDDSEKSDTPFSGPPTTLLAELQMRKAQMKLRNRTAANAFPNGMHSTLLELDAVAQVQQKSRKKKHVTLAWEDHQIADSADVDDDDDVPLGLLVGGQKLEQTINRPMGLMEKREMEDNEPLSRRRARLRGDDANRPAADASEQQRASTMYTLDLPPLADRVLDEQEGETLAQRTQRIKAENGTATGLGDEFTKEISSQLGLKIENVAPAATTPDPEETLGQRRKRLRDEALKNSRQPSGGSAQNGLGVKTRNSMADILSQHPAAGARHSSSESKGLAHQSMLPSMAQYDNRLGHMPTFQQPMMSSSLMPGTMPGTMPAYSSFNAGMPYMNGVAGFNYNTSTMYSTGLPMQTGGYGQNNYMHDPMMMGPPLDPKQRDMIDRWRQDIAP